MHTTARQPTREELRALLPEGGAFLSRAILLDPGSTTAAQNYYDQLADPNGDDLSIPDSSHPFTLDDLLAYCGYAGLRAFDLQRLASGTLMSFTSLQQQASNPAEFTQAFANTPISNGDLIATRFFAPKITDVSGLDPHPRFGWRKVIRLKTRAGSTAVSKKITDLYVLFNFFALPDAKTDPFADTNISPNNQVMLIRTNPRKAYWMVFDEVTATSPGPRIDYLNATFDGRDPQVINGAKNPVRKYYVPDACAQCHGGTTRPKLTFLDTDHWFDRVQPGDDFTALATVPWGVVYDGGKVTADGGSTPTTTAFDDAFAVIRTLNTEIQAQNTAAGPVNNNLHLRGAANWLRLHQTSSAYIPAVQRGFGSNTWTPGNTGDEALLPLLNRFCYRCHSTVRYSIFEKQAVLARKDEIHERLETTDLNTVMPQDRKLGPTDLQRLLSAVDNLN